MPSSYVNNLFTSKKIVAISAAAAVGLAGASLAQIKAATGVGGAKASCPSFSAESWGDPHIRTYFDGQKVAAQKNVGNVGDLSRVMNTVDGEVRLATKTTIVASGAELNKQAIMESKNWKVVVSNDGPNNMRAVITAADGTKTVIDKNNKAGYLAKGLSPAGKDGNGNATGDLAYMDGDGNIHVSIPLSSGGFLETKFANASSYGMLNVKQDTFGAAVVGGLAARQATDSDFISVNPCTNQRDGAPPPFRLDNLGADATGNVTSVTGGDPTAATGNPPVRENGAGEQRAGMSM